MNYRSEFTKQRTLKTEVRAMEIVLAVPREDSVKIDLEKWKEDNVKWLQKTFNVSPDGKDNVLSVVYHGDESNAHIHAVVVPMAEDGRFLANDRWLNSRKK